MNKNIKKLCTTFLITFALMYACFVIVKQEMQFVEYKKEIDTYARLIEKEELKNEQLNITKDGISSDKYIEEVAREKLGLVLPSEIIFVNANI